jgi:hypothetical protein
MGSYDLVKITVSHNQAEMVTENLSYETNIINGKLERKINESPVFILSDEVNNSTPEYANVKSKLHVNIVFPDKNLRRELPGHPYGEGFTIGKRFHKPYKDSIVISKVTIHPKRKYNDYLLGEYHLIMFETMGELTGGTHRVLVKDPLAFTFLPFKANRNGITMLICSSENIESNNFLFNDSNKDLPVNLSLQVLSKIISTTKKPIKIIFTANG